MKLKDFLKLLSYQQEVSIYIREKNSIKILNKFENRKVDEIENKKFTEYKIDFIRTATRIEVSKNIAISTSYLLITIIKEVAENENK